MSKEIEEFDSVRYINVYHFNSETFWFCPLEMLKKKKKIVQFIIEIRFIRNVFSESLYAQQEGARR